MLSDDREVADLVVGVQDVQQAMVFEARQGLRLQTEAVPDLAGGVGAADGDGPFEPLIDAGPRLDGAWLEQFPPLVSVGRNGGFRHQRVMVVARRSSSECDGLLLRLGRR